MLRQASRRIRLTGPRQYRACASVVPPLPPTAAAPSAASPFAPFPLVDELMDRVPRAIARAITLVESQNPEHAARTAALLREVRQRSEQRNAERKAAARAKRVIADAAASEAAAAAAAAAADADAAVPDAVSEAGPADCDKQAAQGGAASRSPVRSLFAEQLELNRSHSVGSMRIAISGSPGAGKSCFIEALGCLLADAGLRVGVIAVDPSSVVSGGSILGDKTRMERLSMHPNAFVRPSPSRGHLGGVTARCWETMEIFEAADFDVTLVETVGVGQSEVAARNMTDLFLLLVPPASGDELQGIKKGIVEVTDMVVVTKDDGERRPLAQATKVAYMHAVMFQRNSHFLGSSASAKPVAPHRRRNTGSSEEQAEDEMSDSLKPVLTVSAETAPETIAALWNRVERMWLRRRDLGVLSALRKRQCMDHFNEYFNQELIHRARAMLGRGHLEELEDNVVAKKLSPREAGDLALAKILGSYKSS